jgi:hypothetical protein
VPYLPFGSMRALKRVSPAACLPALPCGQFVGGVVAAEAAEVMQVRRVLGELHVEAREDASLDGIESLEQMPAGVLAKRCGDLEAF